MGQKKLGQIDLGTGEILEDGFVAYVAPKRRNGFSKEGWVAMANHAMAVLKQVRSIDDLRVLFALIEQLDFENLIVANQAEIARDLEMKAHNVNRSVKNLIALGAIFEGPRIGVSRSYRLNPEFGWKGSAKNHVVALDQLRKDRMKAARIDGVVQGGKGASSQDEQQPRAAEVSQEDTQTGDLFTA